MTKLLEKAVAKASNLSEEKQDAIAEMVLSEIESGPPLIASQGSHGVLDISPVSLGPEIRLLRSDDDLLGEMLEDFR